MQKIKRLFLAAALAVSLQAGLAQAQVNQDSGGSGLFQVVPGTVDRIALVCESSVLQPGKCKADGSATPNYLPVDRWLRNHGFDDHVHRSTTLVGANGKVFLSLEVKLK